MRRSEAAAIGLHVLFGDKVLVVGLEDEPDGALRVYIGARYLNTFCLLDDEAAKAEVRRKWGSGGHLYITRPPDDAIYQPAPAAGTTGRESDG